MLYLLNLLEKQKKKTARNTLFEKKARTAIKNNHLEGNPIVFEASGTGKSHSYAKQIISEKH